MGALREEHEANLAGTVEALRLSEEEQSELRRAHRLVRVRVKKHLDKGRAAYIRTVSRRNLVAALEVYVARINEMAVLLQRPSLSPLEFQTMADNMKMLDADLGRLLAAVGTAEQVVRADEMKRKSFFQLRELKLRSQPPRQPQPAFDDMRADQSAADARRREELAREADRVRRQQEQQAAEAERASFAQEEQRKADELCRRRERTRRPGTARRNVSVAGSKKRRRSRSRRTRTAGTTTAWMKSPEQPALPAAGTPYRRISRRVG